MFYQDLWCALNLCHNGSILPGGDNVTLLTCRFIQTDSITAHSREEKNRTEINKNNISCLFCFLLADSVVLLSNPVKASFTTDPKSLATDFISAVSNQKIIASCGVSSVSVSKSTL